MAIGPSLRRLAGNAVAVAGTGLARASREILLAPHRRERIELPTPLQIGGHTLDVVDDLVVFTGLSRADVESLVQRRRDSFRVEWHLMQPRSEPWFYLSSRGYLFANAVHFHDAPDTIDALLERRPPPARVLDFGAGTGNLALALAASGLEVDVLESSALQKDFVRFRAHRHGLDVGVLDWWGVPPPPERYDLICAFDVLEHLPELRRALADTLLPALAPFGLLAESSPFVKNFSNPMHHEDTEGLDAALTAAGLRLVEDRADFRLWRREVGRTSS